MSPTPSDEQKHWLIRPSSIRKLWWIFGGILTFTVLAQLLVHVHAYFGVDGWFGFYAAFGFVSCVAMVVVAKLLGFLVKRPDDFYDEDHD